MALNIGLKNWVGWKQRKKINAQPTPPQNSYLLTTNRNIICTAAGNRIRLISNT